MKLTDKEYQILLDIFNNFNELYHQLPEYYKMQFMERLYIRNCRMLNNI